MSGSRPVSMPRIERFLHRSYEMVRSDDLNGQEEAQKALRAWHNRALHQTYGVVFGLDVNLEGDSLTPGALRASVDPGLGYDASGRDVFLREATSTPIPFDPKGMTLVLRFGLPEPTLAWFPTAGFQIDRGVPLAKTVDSTTLEDVVLTGDLPPPLFGKIVYDKIRHRLTIRGLLSQAQFDLLHTLVPMQAFTKIQSVFDAWPFQAPRPSHSIISGLNVTIVSGLSVQTLWAANVTAGRAVNTLGQVVKLESDKTLGLQGRSDERSLILRPSGELNLVSDPLSVPNKDAVTLATIGPPPNPVVQLDSPVRTEVPAITSLLDLLETQNDKIKYDPSGPKITLTGFLTRAEVDDLIKLVADNPESVVSVGQRIDPSDDSNKPQVPLSREDAERAPLFPPRSRPLARPRTATGSSLSGRTEWKDVTDTTSDPNFEKYEATVDIEAAGFTEIPQLIAWVERLVLEGDPGADNQPPVPLPFPFLGGIVDPKYPPDPKKPDTRSPDTRKFVFRLWRVKTTVPLDKTNPLPTDWLRNHVYVRWLGLQSDPLPDWNSWPAGRVV